MRGPGRWLPSIIGVHGFSYPRDLQIDAWGKYEVIHEKSMKDVVAIIPMTLGGI
jgi:hypothetical protein